MPPKKRAVGPRPRRAVKAGGGGGGDSTIASASSNLSPDPLTFAKSPDNAVGDAKTTVRSASEVAVLLTSPAPPLLLAPVEATFDEDKNILEKKHEINGSMETQDEIIINAGSKTLANPLSSPVGAEIGSRIGKGIEDKCGGGKTKSKNVSDSQLTTQAEIGLKESVGGEAFVESDDSVAVKKKKKKVVKIVRVVKKIVKKRVPKLVPKGLVACSSEDFDKKMLKKGENLDAGCEEIITNERCREVKEIDLNERSDNRELEKQHFENIGQDVSASLEEEADPIEIVSSDLGKTLPMEIVEIVEKSEQPASVVENEEIMADCGGGNEGTVSETSLVSVPTEVESSNVVKVLSMEKVENPEQPASVPMEVEDQKIMDVYEGGKEGFVGEILADDRNDCIVEKSDSATEMLVKDVNLAGDRNEEYCPEVVDDNRRKEEVKKGNDGQMSSGRIVLSGELEALERRKRRRTEIFIGGLSKDAKEEDVRKVFEEVGEIVEVRLVTNSRTGKNKGFAFVRYASAADAKKALEKYQKVEICGKQCETSLVEGSDTIFLGNIDKKWKDENVIEVLREIGIEKIDKVTVMVDPRNIEQNRGFAFLELETHKDAQIAFKKLQKIELLGKLQNVKVAWAEPLDEPDEEELLKVKSVYAEYLPSSWDEKNVNSYFSRFGEIEDVVLARNLHSSRRKDFAFINFKTREAALTCIESLNHGMLADEGSKVNVKVSLAKPLPRSKPYKKVSKSTTKGNSVHIRKLGHVKSKGSRNEGISTVHINNDRTGDTEPSKPSKLEWILAERALWRQTQARLSTDYSSGLPGGKCSFSTLGDKLCHSDARGYSHMRVGTYYPVGRPSHGEVPPASAMSSFGCYQCQGADYASGYRYRDYPNSSQYGHRL